MILMKVSRSDIREIRRRKRLITTSIALGALAIIGGYTYSRTKDILTGPQILLEYPKDNSTIHDAHLSVIGRAKNTSAISMNGRAIFVDEGGYFEEELLVPRGYSILELVAKDRFDHATTKTVRIVYQ